MTWLPVVYMLCKAGVCTAALQLAGQAAGNIHQDVTGYQLVLVQQQITQQEYYKTLRAYYQLQGHRKRRK